MPKKVQLRKSEAKIASFQRKVDFKPETYNKERNTIDVIFSTGARVFRSSWFEDDYFEELSLDRKSVRLDRLNAGAPFLRDHSGYSVDNVIGVVEKARIDDGVGVATIRLSKREDVQGIVSDILDGILPNVSVGYRVHAYEEQDEKVNGVSVYRATDWEPFEISTVTMPADKGAQVRSAENKNICNLTLRGDAKMDEENNTPAPKKETPAPVNLEQVRQEAIKAERERAAEIRETCEKLGLKREFADKLIASDVKIDEARKQIIAEKAKGEEKTVGTNVEVTRAEADTRREGMVDALFHRSNSVRYKQTEKGKMFRNRSMMDMVRICLESAGVNTLMMSNDDMVKRSFELHLRGGAHTTSDFPLLLEQLVNKTLRDSYAAQLPTWQPITRVVQVPDFKTISRTQLGDAPALDQLAEGAEIKAGTVGEGAEKYNVETYAKMVRISRKAIINDDLAAFTRLPEAFGRRAAEKEADLVWGIILANAALSDSIALFHASHGNLDGSGAAISVASIGAARQAMRKQTGLNGARISLTPASLIVPPELETIAQQFVSPVNSTQGSEVNPFSGKLQVITEPRLSDSTLSGYDVNAWFMAASVDQIDMIELARLSGEDGPVIESSEMFDVEGMKLKCRIDLGAKAIDYRGLYKNVGA